MQLRVLVDRSIVETFAGSGRGVVSTPVLNPGKDLTRTGVFLIAGDQSVTVMESSAWAMGCGWGSYP